MWGFRREMSVLTITVLAVGALAIYLWYGTSPPPIRTQVGPVTSDPELVAAIGAFDPVSHAASLSSEQQAVLDQFKSDDVRSVYVAGFAQRNATSLRPDAVWVLVRVLELCPIDTPDARQIATVGLPEHAAFALASLARAWHQHGPTAESERLALQAARLAGSDDEVLRLQCAMMLSRMKIEPGARRLSESENQTLERLLANDWIAHNVGIQEKLLAEVPRSARGN